MRVEIRQARKGDFLEIPMSTKELQACYAYFQASAFSWTGLASGQIACVWGLVPPTLLSDSAYLWLVTTPVIENHKFVFVRHSQMILDGMLDQFPLIIGHVLANQSQSRKWLKWLGVTFKPAVAEGKLIPFELRRAVRG